MEKLTLVAPSATVTVAGTVAEPGIRLKTDMTTPPGGAGAGTVIVPIAELPALTVPGLTVKADNVGGGGGVPGGFTVRSADTVTPPPVTKTVTTVGTGTADGMSCTPARVLNAGTTVEEERNGSTVELLLLT
jgi:hypothetical protein